MKNKSLVLSLFVGVTLFSSYSASAKLNTLETDQVVKNLFGQGGGKQALPPAAAPVVNVVVRSSKDFVVPKKEVQEYNKAMTAAMAAKTEIETLIKAAMAEAQKTAKTAEELQAAMRKSIDEKKITALSEKYQKAFNDGLPPVTRIGEELVKSKYLQSWVTQFKNVTAMPNEDGCELDTLAWNIVSDGPDKDRKYILGTASIRYEVDKKGAFVENGHVSINLTDIANLDMK